MLETYNQALWVYYLQEADFLDVTGRKIVSFLALSDGWHFGEGVAFEPSILDKASRMNMLALQFGLSKTDAFPGLKGEVIVAIYYQNHYLEFTLKPANLVDIYHEKDGQEIAHQEGVQFEQALRRLWEFSEEQIWKQSDSLTGFTMLDMKRDSVPQTSRIARLVESQSLTKNAYGIRGETSVNISESIIEGSQQISPLLFGASPPTYSPGATVWNGG